MKFYFFHSRVYRRGYHRNMEEKKKFVVVVVDGIIGAGKSSIIELCLAPSFSEWGYKVAIVKEPVEKWKESGSLKQFYNDPSRRGYQFQTRVFHDRVKECQEVYEKYGDNTDIFLLERSIFTDKLFMNILYESQTIDESEYRDYMDLWKMWEKVMPFPPDLFIYLRPDIEVVMYRLRKRNRDGEDSVSIDYQLSLQVQHDNFLGKEFVKGDENLREVPCHHITTNCDFRTDKNIQFKISSEIRKKIDNILNR